MLFALTPGRTEPGPEDVLRGGADLDRAIASIGNGPATLWEVSCGTDPGRRFPIPVERWSPDGSRDRDAFADLVRFCMLRAARDLYCNGDCWVLAYVGAKRHGLVAAMVRNQFCGFEEPAHLVLDLGGDRFLDVHGVSTVDEVLSRLASEPTIDSRRLDGDDIAALYDRLYGDDGYDFEEKLADGFEEQTAILFEMCLDPHVADTPGPAMSP